MTVMMMMTLFSYFSWSFKCILHSTFAKKQAKNWRR